MAIENDAIGPRRVRADRGANVVGWHEGVGGWTETVHDDEPPHELGERARESDRLTAAERIRDHADSVPTMSRTSNARSMCNSAHTKPVRAARCRRDRENQRRSRDNRAPRQ